MSRFVFLFLCALTSSTFAEGPPSVNEARAAFRLADPSLTIDLIAAEPDVVSPVAFAWDEFGRLFVAEMTDYPAAPTGGRIKLLEDRDRDGHYEQVHVFAEKLPYPNGVLPWNGGVLVTAAPDLLFLKDIDGDGKADVRRVVLTGFGEGNQQLRVNSPTWGLDNWVYLANGRSGGAVRRPGDPVASAVPIRAATSGSSLIPGISRQSPASVNSACRATTAVIAFRVGTPCRSATSCWKTASLPATTAALRRKPSPTSSTSATAAGSTRSRRRNAVSTPRPSPSSTRPAAPRSIEATRSRILIKVMRSFASP